MASENPKPQLSEKEILSHEILTIQEVAFLLRMSERTVYNLIYKGALRATRLTSRITIITKESFMNMLNGNIPIPSPSRPAVPAEPEREGSDLTSSTVTEPKEESKSEPKPKRQPRGKSTQGYKKPLSSYKASVKTTYTDGETGPVYTMEEVCKIFNCSYSKLYTIRMHYSIPCVKVDGYKCFPKKAVDDAMAAEEERLGRNLSEDWYSCFDLMKKYGLGKTQVRRFAKTHGVRMKKMYNRKMYYLKADWDAARKEAEKKSASTKKGR